MNGSGGGEASPELRRWGALAAGLAVALLGLWLLLGQVRHNRAERGAWPVESGRLVLDGLAARVDVLRDRRGIPHVRAAGEADALRALGFLHAQDRLGQMLWLRRAARGTTAEWIGAPGLPADRRARVLGIGRHADAQAEGLDRETRRALEAYAAGVNARIRRIRAGRVAPPPLLGAAAADPAPWTPADCLAVVKLYAWALSGSLETTLVLEDLVRHLGGQGARRFFPADAGLGSVPQGTQARLRSRRPATVGGGDPLVRAAGLAGPGVGSSAWVVGGEHSRSGLPLLAADIHQEAAVPSLYYEAHLSGGGLDVAGATLPGVPVFWTGRNPHVAWASVSARAVVTDLYRETLHPDDPTLYHDGRRWAPLEVRRETIQVRGAADVELEVRATRHGPLLDVLELGETAAAVAEPGTEVALAWTGAHTRPGIAGFLGAARAAGGPELRRALERHAEPALVVLYADRRGAAGFQLAGWLPRRGLPTGLVLVPGRARWYDWKGPVPYEELPRATVREGRGWLVASDNRLPGTEASSIEWVWRTGERAGRIDRLLRDATAAGPVDVRAMATLQLDLRAGRAPVRVRHALELAGDGGALGSEAREVAALLSEWDGDVRAESVGAAAYHVFLHELTRRLFEAELGGARLARYLGLPHVSPGHLVGRVLAAGAARDAGAAEREALAPAVRDSLRSTWLYLTVHAGSNRGKWAWGRLHPLEFRPLVPGPGRAGAALGPFPFPGDGASVAAGAFDPARPFDARVASVYRFAADLGEPGHALSSLAPGQSEHPGHPHRDSGLQRWLRGRASLLVLSPLLVEESEAARLELEPAR